MTSLKHILCLQMVVLLCFTTACTTTVPDKPIITVSIEPQRYLLEQIAGDEYDIRTLMASGGNPETYDPTFTNLLNTEHSVAYMQMGNLGFEAAVIDKIRNANPDLPIFDTSRGIHLIMGTHGDHDDADPHTWASTVNARRIAANMAEALATLNPDRSKRYAERLATLNERLDSIDARVGATLSGRVTAFMVWHPSMSYFARDFGLEQVAIGGAEHKEPTALDLAARIDMARRHGARVLLMQKETDGTRAEVLMRDLDSIRAVECNTLSYDWLDNLTAIADTLALYGNAAD